MPNELDLPDDYAHALAQAKARVRQARLSAARAVNAELLALYWSIGDLIASAQQQHGWGAKVIDRLAADLRAEFPHMTGLSRSNLYSMRAFARAWPADAIVQRPVGQLPWGHIVDLLTKLDEPHLRDWYAEQAVAGGWTRPVLLDRIAGHLHTRIGTAATNFAHTLPAPDSELAQAITKDPYVFDFLELSGPIAERQLETAMMDRLQQVLLELGTGFAFVGRQVHFSVAGDDFYIDLLLFHVDLLRYVAVELKIGKFDPAYIGQLSNYVGIVDAQLRRPTKHAPTIGLLLCTDSNDLVVRYTLAGTAAPLAVAKYTYDALPADARQAVPSPAQVAAAAAATVTVDGQPRSLLDVLTHAGTIRDDEEPPT